MPVKVIWDYTYYWALLAPLFMSGRIAALAVLGRLRPQFERARTLNLSMQPFLRAWGEADRHGIREDDRLLDQYIIPWFHEMNRALNDRDDDAAFIERIAGNVGMMQQLAREIFDTVRAAHPEPCCPATTPVREHGARTGHRAADRRAHRRAPDR